MSKQRSFLNLRGRTPVAPDPAQVVIDGYRVEGLLGLGPMTAAYRAVLESHQQSVVLKVLLPHLADSEVFVQRFLQAANAARLVTHDRVLPCYDVGQSNGWVYLAGELMEGGTMADLVAQGPLERSRAIYLAWQVAMGLEAIHAAELIHGNLRPSNVLVDEEDAVRLADLGLPQLPDLDGPATPGILHLPPEQLTGDTPASPAGDIYALGVILTGSLIGRTPWSGSDRARLTALHSEGRNVVGEIPPTLLDADLTAVLNRATAHRPEERYANAWQLREDLERLQYQFAPIHARSQDTETGSTVISRESGIRSTRSVQQPGPVVPPAPRRPWLVGAVVAAAVVLGLVAWLGSSGAQQPVATVPPPVVAAATPPVIIQPAKPSWATQAGSDAYGRWADLTVAGHTQRMRYIAAGSFWMGSGADEAGRNADEDRHLVTISHGYWLADSEVAQGLFSAVTGTAAGHFTGDDRPVESISWLAVQEFLAKLGTTSRVPVRLPSEAEWEFACRGKDGSEVMPLPSVGWTAEAGIEGTKPIRSLKPNQFGLYDMLGNVQEWVADTYGRYPRESSTDPLVTGGVYRVARGGAWNLDAAAARPAARSKALPVTSFFYLGFRIAISDG